MPGVVVVGGGITGVWLAYLAARAGMPVTLVETAGIGNQASGHNPGGLNPLHGPQIPGIMSPLALRAYHLHCEHAHAIAGLSGMDFGYRTVPRIEVALDAQDMAGLAASGDLYNATPGFSARLLDRVALLSLEPRIAAGIDHGLLMEGNAMVDSHRYVQALAQAARKLGARTIAARACGVEPKDGRTAVVLDNGDELAADALVLATGAWAAEAAPWLGLSIPVEPVKGELLRAELPGGGFRYHVSHGADGLYARPDGQVLLGGTWSPAGFDAEPSASGLDAILKRVARFVPAVREAKVLEHMGALRPVTPDRLPLIGTVPGWGNVYLATGGGSKGMLLSAGMAEGIVSLIAGHEPPLALEAFAPSRFH